VINVRSHVFLLLMCGFEILVCLFPLVSLFARHVLGGILLIQLLMALLGGDFAHIQLEGVTVGGAIR
jgi:hypothetical protein